MEIRFLVIEKSWKIIVEKEWSPCKTRRHQYLHETTQKQTATKANPVAVLNPDDF